MRVLFRTMEQTIAVTSRMIRPTGTPLLTTRLRYQSFSAPLEGQLTPAELVASRPTPLAMRMDAMEEMNEGSFM